MKSLQNLKLDLRAFRERKRGSSMFINNLYIDTLKNILFFPSLWIIIVYRFGQLLIKIKPLYIPYMFFVWRPCTVITGIEIYPETQIGGGIVLPHFGQIFINPNVKIGTNCLIFNGVTIGCDFNDHGSPEIGNNVRIGVGAKIIGPIKISDNAKVKANELVTKNII